MNPPADSSHRQKALAAIPPPTPQYRKPRLTAGRIFYLLYHAPRGALKKGPAKMFRGWLGKRRLYRALGGMQLPEVRVDASQPALGIHALIGARYLPEACLLTHSLTRAARRTVVPTFYDDGTLTPDDCALLRSKLPRARFHLRPEIEDAIEAQLPEQRYPCLRRLRPAYPHIRKLTDVHRFGAGWKFVSDADILFFAPPTALLDHLQAPRACHMVDFAPAYGVPVAALAELAGRPVHPQINVGLCHLPSAALDWDFIEDCAARLLARHGFTYYLEQALTAIILARLDAVPLPPDDYVVYPRAEVARQSAVPAMHYVDDSRAYYYDFAWRQALGKAGDA